MRFAYCLIAVCDQTAHSLFKSRWPGSFPSETCRSLPYASSSPPPCSPLAIPLLVSVGRSAFLAISSKTMNFLRRAKPLLRSLLSPGGGGGGVPTPAICQSGETLNPRFRYYPPPPRYSSPIHRPVPAAQWRRSYSYYVDRNQVQHFRLRGRPRWYKSPRVVFLAVVVGGGLGISVYYGNLETVPYTKRKHFILISPDLERQLGEAQFEQLKTALRPKILPAIHPDSVRVRLISKEIIDALQRGLHHEDPQWTDISYAPDAPAGIGDKPEETILPLRGEKVEGRWSREDEVLDEGWVQRSRKEGEARGSRPSTKNLEGLNWEVLVVKDDLVNAFCLPGGKIVVFTGLLNHFRTDAEIATVIGHEVGHCVARHAAEMITKNMWLFLLQLVLLQFIFMPDVINAMSTILLKLPFSRSMEIEADYIGLLLLASAGYDPCVAPKVYEKLGQITGDSELKDYLSTHPSSKKRAQLLSQGKVMEEAHAIYREVIAGRGVEGFL